MSEIYVDADGCPVKDEVYRVARRYGLAVTLVANAPIFVPEEDGIRLVVVDEKFDAADDWIAARAGGGDVVVTADLPLAARCLEKGARVIGPRGEVFSQDSIGDVLASRALNAHLRDIGTIGGGPPPFEKKDRSRFLQRLDDALQAIRRGKT